MGVDSNHSGHAQSNEAWCFFTQTGVAPPRAKIFLFLFQISITTI